MRKTRKLLGKKFCPNCGALLHGRQAFCDNCRKADFNFKEMKVILCNSCRSYMHKNKWTKFHDIDTAIKKVVADAVKAKIKYVKLSKQEKELLLSYKAGVNKDITISVEHKHEHYALPAKLSITLCPKCSKKGTQYFEAVMQLRNASNAALDFAHKEISKLAKKGLHINKETRLSDKDLDMYLTKKTYTKNIALKLRKNFGGVMKENAQHYSLDKNTSKVMYRQNILMEFPNYAKGDVILLNNDLLKIVSISDKIKLESLRTGHKTTLPHSEYDILKPARFLVIKKYPEYEVLDPETYYQARLMNPDDKLEINQKIKCIIDGGEAWMV